ncbi:MAG: hypothetical protein ACTHN4_02685 [Sphingomicrobium sp.]
MSGDWRPWALTASVVVALCGAAVWWSGGGPVLLAIGAVMLVTALLERTYGSLSGRPGGGDWRPTDEKFVDPETGRMVTVWFDPSTGGRRYVADESGSDPLA